MCSKNLKIAIYIIVKKQMRVEGTARSDASSLDRIHCRTCPITSGE